MMTLLSFKHVVILLPVSVRRWRLVDDRSAILKTGVSFCQEVKLGKNNNFYQATPQDWIMIDVRRSEVLVHHEPLCFGYHPYYHLVAQ